MQPTTEFMAAVQAHLALMETLGEDHPETTKAMLVAMDLAPQQFKNEILAKAQSLGLIPEAIAYTDAGEPLFSLEAVADKLGITPEEANEAVEKMLAERTEAGLSNAGLIVTDPAQIHTKQ